MDILCKEGEVSPLYECGESDRLLVIGLTGINKEGYRPVEAVKDQLRAEIIKDKKAEKIMTDIKAKNISSFDQCKSIANVTTDSVKHVTFNAPTYVAMTRGSEPVLGAYASVTEINKVSSPIKGNSGVYVLQVYNKEKLMKHLMLRKKKKILRTCQCVLLADSLMTLYES